MPDEREQDGGGGEGFVRPDEAVRIALGNVVEGKTDVAARILEQVVEAAPGHADAVHYLGLVRVRQGRLEDGEACIRRAIELCPDFVDAHSNLGNVLSEFGRHDEAVACYERALNIRPDFVSAWNNLGVALRHVGRIDESIEALRRALELDRRDSDAHYNLASSLKRVGRLDEAIDSLVASSRLDGDDWPAFRNLGNALYTAGRVDDAADVYRSWLEREPDHPIALHMLAACTGEGVPERASDSYVSGLFDSFSHKFDEVLGKLEYRAPALVTNALQEVRPASDVVVDAGCGTGLCGPLLRPIAGRLVGVDLSQGMLEKARVRESYDELVCSELTEYLSGATRSADAIVSADTLIYFGRLDPVFHAAAAALRRDGHFVFTVESPPEDDADLEYRMEVHGRYTHGAGYVRRALEATGFDVVSTKHETLRKEQGRPVAGLLVVARRRG